MSKFIYIPLKDLNGTGFEKDTEILNNGKDFFIEDTPINRGKYNNILPLGFKKEKIELSIDLIPSTSWGASLANSLETETWASIRKPFIENFNNRCQICGNKGKTLSNSIKDVDAHEIWEYKKEGDENIQKLKGFMALCSSCHLMFHLGFAKKVGKKEITIKRIIAIEKLNEQQARKRIKDIFNIWQQRSYLDWTIDISILKENGYNNIKLKKGVDKEVFKL